MYGGTEPPAWSSSPVKGLSPRVRGNRSMSRLSSSSSGSIPACTGEPRSVADFLTPGKVYPRVYGGTAGSRASHAAGRGLSPRVRGNPLTGQRGFQQRRSIPACTGEPRRKSPRSWTITVYPRVYGGTHLRHSQQYRHRGLSPRVRGNPAIEIAAVLECGSIPACTGEPNEL